MLNIYTIHDDPTHFVEPEERWWAAIAAETEHDAIVIAAVIYDGDAPRDEWDWKEAFTIDATIDQAGWPEKLKPQYPEHIRDPEPLRLCGFKEQDEDECQECNLSALGIKEYYVCPDCYVCRDCGCECEES